MFLSLFSAFGQAFSWALRKKALREKGLGNTLGLVSFLVSSLILFGVNAGVNGLTPPALSDKFIIFALLNIVIHVLAIWAGHRALERANYSLLLPFMSLSALMVIPIEYFLSALLPNTFQVFGVMIVVAGAILVAAKRFPDKSVCHGVGYFLLTVIGYSVLPVLNRICILETNNPYFTMGTIMLGISIGFLFLIYVEKEAKQIKSIIQRRIWKRIVLSMVVVGAATVVFGLLPTALALMKASATEVTALKRTMPLFALLLGFIMFREKITVRHVFGTLLLVIGCLLVVWFK